MTRLFMPLMALLAVAPAWAADDDWGARTARVAALEGTLVGRAPFEDAEWDLVENAVLRAGDELVADDMTFAEIELPRDAFLRLAPGSGATLQRLSDESADVALASGSLALSRHRDGMDVAADTLAGRVLVHERSHVRVDGDAGSSRLRLRVYAGSAELRAPGGSWTIGRDEVLTWTAGSAVRETASGELDAFDRWTLERERRVRGVPASSYLGSGYVGWRDLDGWGSWQWVDGAWGWCPSRVDAGWRPYSHGHWVWREPWGWTWVSGHRWGYVTSHYGRWHYSGTRGWCWYPERTWGPGWVSWAVFGGQVGWAPCDFHGRPVRFDRHVHYDHRAWSHCDADYFRRGGWRGDRHGRGHDRDRDDHDHHDRDDRDRDDRDRADATTARRIFPIRQFDAETLSRLTPLPVRDVRLELAPERIVDAAERGRLRGVAPGTRRSTLLDRATREGDAARPQPWVRDDGDGDARVRRGAAAPGAVGAVGAPDADVPTPAVRTLPEDRSREGWVRPRLPDTTPSTVQRPGTTRIRSRDGSPTSPSRQPGLAGPGTAGTDAPQPAARPDAPGVPARPDGPDTPAVIRPRLRGTVPSRPGAPADASSPAAGTVLAPARRDSPTGLQPAAPPRPRPDASRMERPRVETPRVETAPVAPLPVAPPRVESPRVAPARPEAPRRVEPPSQLPRLQPARPEPPRAAPRVETPRAQPRIEPPRVEPPRVEPPKVEPQKADPPKARPRASGTDDSRRGGS